MRLLQFAQGVNTALSIADTSRSLVSGRGGSAQSVSELSEQINNVGAELTSEIRGGVAAVRQDIGIVNNMVSTVLAQQAVLHREIQQVIHGVASLNTLIQKHAHVIGEQLRFIIDEPFQNACRQLTDHLSNKGIAATDDEIRPWLRTLHTLIDKDFSGMQKLAAISSSEESVLFLSQPDNADNIAFIAGRLHLLFGEMIPDKFLQLPPVSLKFYYLIATLYLKTLEKNPNLMAADKAQPICQKIVNTLKTYLEFATFLKDHPEIIQALFDRYDYQLPRNSVIAQELRALLKNIVPLVEIKKFTEKLRLLEKSSTQSIVSVSSNTDIWDNLPTQPNDRIKKLFSLLSQDNPPTAARTKYMLLPEGAAYTPIPSSIHWASGHASPDGSSTSSAWGCSHFPNHPKPPAFVNVSVLFLLLAAGYADINFFRNSTLKKQVAQLIASCPGPYSYTRTTGGTYYTAKFEDGSTVRIHGTPEYSTTGSGVSRLEFSYNGGSYDSYSWRIKVERCDDSKTEYVCPYSPNSSIYSGHRANIFEYHAKLTDELPKEYEALLKHAAPADIEKYKILFKYYVLFSQGRIKEAETFIRQQTFAQDYEKSYFLFMVAILGRWDIFEAFNKIYPISDYIFYFKDTTVTPLMLAEQNNHVDVVEGLKKSVASVSTIVFPSDYERGLKEMCANVEASKTKLGAYVPAPPVEQQSVSSVQAMDPLPDEETGDEQENRLNKAAREFFTKKNKHAEKTIFCHKPTKRPWHRPGFRLFDNTLFVDQDQRQELDGFLRTKYFISCEVEDLDNALLIKLGTKISASRH